MTTSWTLPSHVDQYAEPGAELIDIAWEYLDNIKSLDNRSSQSNGNLIHSARSPKLDVKNKTYFVRATVPPAGVHELQQKLEWLPRTIRLNQLPNSEGEVKCIWIL